MSACPQAIRRQVMSIDERLKNLGRELNLLADEFTLPASDEPIHLGNGASARTINGLFLSVADALHCRIPELAEQLDEQLQKEFFAKHGGLRGVLEKQVDFRGPFADVLRGAARTAVFRAMNQLNIADLLLASDKESDESSRPLRALLEVASPPLLQCGGSQRLLVVCPEGSNDAALQEAFRHHLDEKPSVVHDRDGDLVLCYEAEQLSLADVAAYLIGNRREYVEAASRLHTRIDVRWLPLLQIS